MPAFHRIREIAVRVIAPKGGRHLLHARLGLLRPRHAGLGLDVDGRHVGTARKEDTDRREPKQVVAVTAQVHLRRRVHADATNDEQPGWVLADVLQDLLEGLAVEERRLDLHPFVAGQRLRDPQVRLVDLREAGVDDLLVQLFLLFEAKDLRCFGAKDVDDAVEHCVVEVGVVDGDGFNLLAEDPREVDRRPQPGE